MGRHMILKFRHVGTPKCSSFGAARKPKSAGSAVCPIPFKAAETIKNISGGNLPRAFQLLTADNPTPDDPAMADVPPKASMTASTVVSMDLQYSRFVNVSSLHGMAVDLPCGNGTIPAMP